jgi:hypothetical protein
MDTDFKRTPEGMFLDEAIRVIKAINARTLTLIQEYEQLKRQHFGHATEPLANEPAEAVKAGR